MSVRPITITPHTTLATAASMMLSRRINCLPICEDGSVVGIMTTVDLVVAMQCLAVLVEDFMSQLGLKVSSGAMGSDGGQAVGSQTGGSTSP
jgi:CBS domain-containing protein